MRDIPVNLRWFHLSKLRDSKKIFEYRASIFDYFFKISRGDISRYWKFTGLTRTEIPTTCMKYRSSIFEKKRQISSFDVRGFFSNIELSLSKNRAPRFRYVRHCCGSHPASFPPTPPATPGPCHELTPLGDIP